MSACKSEMHVAIADKAVDEKAIRQVLDEVSRTFNAGDYEGMFAQYRDDVVVSSPGQPDIVGKEAWRAGLGALPKGVTLNMRFDTTELEIDGDMAYERGTFVIQAKDPKADTLVPVVTARHIHIFRREADGKWKGWRLMENSADPATALLPPAPPPK
ncbi:MAG: nuclear transport factor 2 family protein [Pseudomonadota bacterium]